jgi:hypothetical protein
MATPLANLFSRIDAYKRGLFDMVRNPGDALSMMSGRIVESEQQAQALQEQTFGDSHRPFRVTDPQAMARLTDMLMAGPMGFAPAGITVYHGSPYLFRQFDPSKAGTGEGAQAYGVGAGYTAEARSVAEGYKDKLSGTKVVEQTTGKILDTRDIPIEKMKLLGTEYTPFQGYLYKGDIPDEILPKFLDWDKPLSQQSEEVKKVFQLDKFPDAVYQGKKLADMTGLEIYVATGSRLGEPFSNSPKAAKYLEKKGLRGIRYLDQGSRKEGAGTFNFVPFRPEDFKIKEINDRPISEFEDIFSNPLLQDSTK